MIALLDSISDATWEQVEEKAREYDTIVNRIKKKSRLPAKPWKAAGGNRMTDWLNFRIK